MVGPRVRGGGGVTIQYAIITAHELDTVQVTL